MGRAWAKRSSKNKKIRLAAIAAALSTGGIVIALLPSANADQKAPQVSAKNADALVEAESFDNVMVKAPAKFASVRFSCVAYRYDPNPGFEPTIEYGRVGCCSNVGNCGKS